MKNLLSLLLLLTLLPSFAAAEQKYGFANASINYLNWSQTSEKSSDYSKSDFYYFELEGGAGYDWGDVYGFFDLENAFKDSQDFPNNRRTAAKGAIAYKIMKSNLNLYAQVYDFSEDGFSEQNRVYGVRYDIATDFGLWFKPFIGLHDVTQTYFSGLNGFMGGWTFGYDFKIKGERFSIVNWHEMEFMRRDAYGKDGANGSNVGTNGAISFWYHVPLDITFGVQYRYAKHKLGSKAFLDGMITSVKYNF